MAQLPGSVGVRAQVPAWPALSPSGHAPGRRTGDPDGPGSRPEMGRRLAPDRHSRIFRGGHLVSTAGTHFDAGKPDAEDPVERVSSRPDRSGSVPTRRSRNGPGSARSGSRARVSSTALAVVRLRPHGEKKKNRPENQFRTTTSPLVVRHQSTGRLVEGLNLRGTNLESRPCQEKGRTGGRARRPARPLAGSRFTRGKTTVARGWLLII